MATNEEHLGNASILPTRLMTVEEIRAWRKPATWRMVIDLVSIWSQIALGALIYAAYPHPLTFILGFLLIAGGQHALGLANHEFAHRTMIPGNTKLNDFIGKWFFGSTIGAPLEIFRIRHFKHHRTYSTSDDTKIAYWRDIRGYRLFIEIMRHMLMFEYFYKVYRVLIMSYNEEKKGGINPLDKKIVMRNLPPVIVSQLVIFGFFFLIGHPWMYIFMWIIPILTTNQLYDKIRALMEHRPLDSDSLSTPPSGSFCDPEHPPKSGYFRGTSGPFVRSVKPSLFERIFLGMRLNFGYHAEHHLVPTVCYQKLPVLRERMLKEGLFDDPRFGLEKSYLSTIKKLWLPARQGDVQGVKA